MSTFADQLMVRCMDPANVDVLLVPQSDTTRQRAQALLAWVYRPQLLTVQSLDSITVTAQSFQVPVIEPMPFNGTWEKDPPAIGVSRELADGPTTASHLEIWGPT